MALGDFVRVSKAFLEAFKAADNHTEVDGKSSPTHERRDDERRQLCQDLKVFISSSSMRVYAHQRPRPIKTSFRDGASKMTASDGLSVDLSSFKGCSFV
jgi:hypothetical protein